MNEDWARTWCEAMNSGDAPRALAFYASNIEFEDVPFQMTASGDDFLPVMDHFVGRGNNNLAFVRFSGGREGGAVESVWRAQHDDDFLGVPAAGRVTEARLVTVMAFDEEGLIKRHCDYWDAKAVLAQLSEGD